VYCTSTMMQMT